MTSESKTAKSFCRICPAVCGLDVEVEDGRIVGINADRGHALSRGYSCRKGRNWTSQLYAADRLSRCLRRRGSDGGFDPMGRSQALDEIAEKLGDIRARYGPRAIATYSGTGLQMASVGTAFVERWLSSLGSSMAFTSMTVDQPAKAIAGEWHGLWGAGDRSFDDAEATLVVGSNPIVSAMKWPGGPPGSYPSAIKIAKKRGHRLIVVDPRRTETASLAELHIQPLPGRDPWILAGMIRCILKEDLHDRAFCEAYTTGLAQLRKAIEPFDPIRVSAEAGVPPSQIVEAARLFAGATKATAVSGTGPDMAPLPNLSEYLMLCLKTVCGQWARAGERVPIPSVLMPDVLPVAQPLADHEMPPTHRPLANAERTRIREVRRVYGEMPSAVLADEILLPGDGQVRALVVIGGNPLAAFPDQPKVRRALENLDLLICIDLAPTATTRLADYILPAAHPLEREELHTIATMVAEFPFGQYVRGLVEPPGDCAEESFFLIELSRRLGSSIDLPGGRIDPDNPPSKIALLQMLFPSSRVPITEIAQHLGGFVFEKFSNIRVAPASASSSTKMQLAHERALHDIDELTQASVDHTSKNYPYLLISRRSKDVCNSMCHEFPGNSDGNPLFMHPDDLAGDRLRPGDVVDLISPDGRVLAVVDADATMRRGVASMWHCYGSPDAEQVDPRIYGTPVGRLISTDQDTDPITGMARQSAIPIRIEKRELTELGNAAIDSPID